MPPPKDPEKYKLWQQRQSLSHKNYKHSIESRNKMSKSRKGIKLSENHKLKISKSLIGRIRTEEERKSISKARLSAHITLSNESKQKISNFMKGNIYRKGFLHTDDTKNHLSEVHKNIYDNLSQQNKDYFRFSFKGKKHKKETRIKMSMSGLSSWSKIDRFSRYKLSLKNRKFGFFYSIKNQKEIYYNSSYELKYLIMLENDNSIVSFERCPFSIPYIFKNVLRSYWPDFLIVTKEKNIVVEIKPIFFQSSDINIIKQYSAISFLKQRNIEYKIIGEDVLFLNSTQLVNNE